MNHSKVYQHLLATVQQGGDLVETLLKSEKVIQEKGKIDYVTSIDLATQEFLMDALGKVIPNCSFVAEEAGYSTDMKDGYCWVIDPIDGTNNLIHNYPHFCIAVGLFKDKRPIASAIYNPMRKELFHALKGKGAYLNHKKITVSKNSTLERSLVGFGFPRHSERGRWLLKMLQKLMPSVQGLRRTGSAALDLAYVASGRIDGFFEVRLKLWDYGAGILLIEEAGGKITNLDNQPLELLLETGVVASNGLIHELLVGN